MANFSKSFNFRNGVQVDNDKFIVKPTTGLVGIGITQPTEVLDVVGNIKATGITSAKDIFAGAGITVGYANSNRIMLDIDPLTGVSSITAQRFYGDGSNLSGIFAISVAGFVATPGILTTFRKVGIGSDAPEFQLDIIGDTRVVGASTFVGVTTVSDLFADALGVSGASILKGGSIIENGVTINQSNVTGVSTFGGAVDINAGLDVDGQADLDEVVVAGVSTFSALVDVNNRLDVVGGANIDQANVSGVSTFGGAIDANAGADISGGETVLSSATVSDLTDNRIVIAGTSGALEDSGNLTFTGTQFTVTGDVAISGVSTLSGNLQVGSGATVGFAKSLSMSDGAQINLGDQDDLVIRHTGTRSEILERGTGGLKIFSDDLEISNASGLGTALKVTLGDQLQIFQDGDQKFNTTGAGVSVYNQLFVGSLNGGISGLSTHTGMLSYGEDLADYSGRRSLDLVNNDSGNLNFYLNINDIQFNSVDRTGNFNWIKGSSNSPSMTLTGIGGSLGIGVTNPSAQFQTSGNAIIGTNLTVSNDLTVTNDLNVTSGQIIADVQGTLEGNVYAQSGVSTFFDVFFGQNLTVTDTTFSTRFGANTVGIMLTLTSGEDTLIDAVAGGQHHFLSNNGFVGIRTSDKFSNIIVNGSNANAVFQSFGVGSYDHFQSTQLQRGAVDFANAGVSTQRYMVPPKVTTTERNALTGLVEGAMIYNTNNNRLEFYTQNSDWVGVATVA